MFAVKARIDSQKKTS